MGSSKFRLRLVEFPIPGRISERRQPWPGIANTEELRVFVERRDQGFSERGKFHAISRSIGFAPRIRIAEIALRATAEILCSYVVRDPARFPEYERARLAQLFLKLNGTWFIDPTNGFFGLREIADRLLAGWTDAGEFPETQGAWISFENQFKSFVAEVIHHSDTGRFAPSTISSQEKSDSGRNSS